VLSELLIFECNSISSFLNIFRAGVRYIRTSIRPKKRFWLPYQPHSSSADCARELFKASNRSTNRLVCTLKKFFVGGCEFFCEWRHKSSSFWVILAGVARPRAQPLSQSVSHKFLLETRLESESFVIDFLVFLGQKLWSKINKLINCLIS